MCRAFQSLNISNGQLPYRKRGVKIRYWNTHIYDSLYTVCCRLNLLKILWRMIEETPNWMLSKIRGLYYTYEKFVSYYSNFSRHFSVLGRSTKKSFSLSILALTWLLVAAAAASLPPDPPPPCLLFYFYCLGGPVLPTSLTQYLLTRQSCPYFLLSSFV